MSDAEMWTEEAVRAFAAAHGLAHLPPEQMRRLVVVAQRAAAAGAAIPRQPEKSSEPAGVFRVKA